MTPDSMRTTTLLSVQRALLGEAFPALRGITVEWSPLHIKFYAYVDGQPRDEDLESLSVVSAEMAADFDEDVQVDYAVLRVDAPQPIQDMRTWCFRRRE